MSEEQALEWWAQDGGPLTFSEWLWQMELAGEFD